MVPNSGRWTFFPIDTLNAYTFLSIFMTSPNTNAFVLHFMQVVVSFDGLFSITTRYWFWSYLGLDTPDLGRVLVWVLVLFWSQNP